MRDLGTLRVASLIVHEIPARSVGGGGQRPVLSEIESPLTQDLKNYFREKIVLSLLSAAFDVVFDPASTSPVPALVLDNLGPNSGGFVNTSKEMAQHLYGCQTGVNPAGLLTVIQTTVEGLGSLAILKLEKEAGVRVRQGQHQGKATFNIEHIRELMLTDRTKVFKVGLFVQEGTTLESIDGTVSDKQRGYLPATEVADFFLKKFLGCELCEAAEVTTKRFFQASQTFINEQVSDSEVKGRYQIALLAALTSEAATLNPRSFAEQNLILNDRQRYTDSLSEAGLESRPFEKDTSLINAQLRRIQLDFDSGIAVLGPPETFDEYVTMTDLDDGRTRVEIEDRLKGIHGKR